MSGILRRLRRARARIGRTCDFAQIRMLVNGEEFPVEEVSYDGRKIRNAPVVRVATGGQPGTATFRWSSDEQVAP